MNMKQLLKAVKERECNCNSCQRNRRFFRAVEKLPKADQKWMVNFYNYVMEIETELEMRNAHRN